MRRRLIVIALLSIVLLVLLDSATDDDMRELTGSELALNLDFDYFMSGVDSTRFDLEGNPSYRIQARRFTHYPEPDHTLVEAPKLVIYRASEQPWRISARDGRVNAGPGGRAESVELSGEVVVSREDAEGRELNIYTEFLTLYPDSRTATTDREVRLETEGSRLTALGMTADLNSQHIQLLGEGRGTYDQ